MTIPSGKHSPQTGRRVTNCPTEAELTEIQRSLTGLKYGTVVVVVQDGVVVQIDRTEKHRLRIPNGHATVEVRGDSES